MSELFSWLVGADTGFSELSTIQMVTRTFIVYGIALLLIRLAKRRFLGGYTAFDILMGFVVGSIMSRTITGRETLFSAVVVILTLLLIHYLISYVTYESSLLSRFFKNECRDLVKGGVVDEEAMRESKLGDNDLLQALRQSGGVREIEEVDLAILERDGSITVIPKKPAPKILSVNVEEGVQRVEITLG